MAARNSRRVSACIITRDNRLCLCFLSSLVARHARSNAHSNTRLIDIDDFTGKLWQIHLAVKKEGYVQVRDIQLIYISILT
jgi:hypothetical protein